MPKQYTPITSAIEFDCVSLCEMNVGQRWMYTRAGGRSLALFKSLEVWRQMFRLVGNSSRQNTKNKKQRRQNKTKIRRKRMQNVTVWAYYADNDQEIMTSLGPARTITKKQLKINSGDRGVSCSTHTSVLWSTVLKTTNLNVISSWRSLCRKTAQKVLEFVQFKICKDLFNRWKVASGIKNIYEFWFYPFSLMCILSTFPSSVKKKGITGMVLRWAN